jgi:two-component system response regulator AtoC
MNKITADTEESGVNLFFVSDSPAIRKLRMQAELLAKVNVPVLILGESGSGQHIASKLIHRLSARAEHVFLKVNCAVLPEDVLEGELFGYERGARTGAMRERQGKFELCHNGTILLDEITEMPVALQAKLLHVLQEKQIFRLGGDTAVSVNARIMAATNVNIEKALTEKRLREDLYYRLSAFTVQVPPLRDCREDIPVLLGHFIQEQAQHYGLKPRPVSFSLLNACQNYSWPGNLRELENVAKRYLVMGDEFVELGDSGGRSVTQSDEGLLRAPSAGEPNLSKGYYDHSDPASLKSLVRSLKGETERNVIASTLEKTHWNRKAAARELGISYRGLLYKIQEYQLIPSSGYLSTLPRSGGWKRSRPAQ